MDALEDISSPARTAAEATGGAGADPECTHADRGGSICSPAASRPSTANGWCECRAGTARRRGPVASSAPAAEQVAAATPIPVEAEKRPAEQASAASEEAPSPKRDRTAVPTVQPGARGGLAPAARMWLSGPDEAQTSAAAASSASPPLSAETRPSTPPAPGTAAKKQRTAEPTIHEVNEVSTVCEAEEGESATDLMASS